MGLFNHFRIWVLTICLVFQFGYGFYLQGSYPHNHGVGDPLSVKVNSLTSIETEMPFLAITVCPSVSPKRVSRTAPRISVSLSWGIGSRTRLICLRCIQMSLRSSCVSWICYWPTISKTNILSLRFFWLDWLCCIFGLIWYFRTLGFDDFVVFEKIVILRFLIFGF